MECLIYAVKTCSFRGVSGFDTPAPMAAEKEG